MAWSECKEQYGKQRGPAFSESFQPKKLAPRADLGAQLFGTRKQRFATEFENGRFVGLPISAILGL